MTIESSHIELADNERNQDFEELAEPHRREIRLHCYRMLGSLHETEDLVQETYLRAWRSFSSFEGGSMRAWLYKIATNACLNALESRKHQQRYLPDQLGPAVDSSGLGAPATDIPWLEPYPDTNLEGIADAAPNPEARYTLRESVQLAFVAAIQQLPPRQRAALMLCDVLGWASAEAATLLGGSATSMNSALQRARETLSHHYPASRQCQQSPTTPAQQKLLRRYLKAWEGHDLDGFVALLKEDTTLTMPPTLRWFVGREAIHRFSTMVWTRIRPLRLLPTTANGQPAFMVYERSVDNSQFAARSIHALTLTDDSITALTVFGMPRLFDAFGFPSTLHDETNTELPARLRSLE